MAMMIAKFHKLIQSRLLWIIFLVVIVFSFVIWGMVSPKAAKDARDANAVGKLNGENVPFEEFRHAYLNTYLSVAMMLGRPINITDELDENLREAAWRRLVTLRKARELGMTVSDPQVVAAIQGHPGFQAQGRFSQMMYDYFVQQVLAAMGFSERQFEEHVREEIAIQKLRHMITEGVLISPHEVTRAFNTLSDIFDVEYTVITPEDVRDEVSVTDEEVKTLFDENPEAFTIPPKVRISYVRFPVEDYLEEVELDEDAALMYYEDQIDDYTEVVVTTNLVKKDEEDIAEGAEDEADMFFEEIDEDTVITPFEDVEEDITETLVKNLARSAAADKATDFVIGLAPDSVGDAPAFSDLAEEYGLTIYEIEPFTATEELDDIDAGLAFNEAAFRLRPGPDEYFSDAIPGEDYVYVAVLEERIDARVPEFEEVQDDVREVLEARALEEALANKAQDLREAVIDGLAGDTGFADTVESFGLEASLATNVTAATGVEDSEYSDLLLRAILVRNEGEVSEVVPAEDALLLAYVSNREPGDLTSYGDLKPRITQMLRNDRAGYLFEEWQDYLLRQANFEPKEEPEVDYDEDYEAEDDYTQEDMDDLEELPEEDVE